MTTLEKTILNGLVKPVAVVHPDKKFVTANNKMKEILGLPEDYTERYLFELIEDESLVIKFTEPVYLKDEEISISDEYHHEKYLLQVESCIIPGEEKPGRVIVLDDISDLKRKEDIILGKLEKMICRVFQPLTEVVGYYELHEISGPTPTGYAAEIKEALSELTRLLDQVQCFIYLLKGNFHLNRTLVSPETALNDFLATVSLRKDIHLKKNIEKTGSKIEVDISKLHQVFYIALDNAMRFSPAGGTVTISLIDKGDHIEYSVKDEGPGMTGDKLQQVFDDVFYEHEISMEEDVAQLGIGIPLARRIIREHGGTFWIDTSPGKGSDVRIALMSQ